MSRSHAQRTASQRKQVQAKFRKRLIALDGEQCRNPFHEQTIADLVALGVLTLPTIFRFIAHHIKYKSHGVDNSPENGIMLCQHCDWAVHHGHGSIKDPNRLMAHEFMLKILDALEDDPDYRWRQVHDKLRLKYAS